MEAVERTVQAIREFRGRFEIFTQVGLQHKDKILKQLDSMELETRERYRQLLKWAKRDKTGDYIWDPEQVSKWSDQMKAINEELQDVEVQTKTINRR